MKSYSDNKDLTVVNFFGGPCAGKSLNRAGLFSLMKRNYIPVEEIAEYAKDLVWSGRHNMFTEQDYIFAKQNHRQRRLVGQVKFAVTDSPIAIGLLYMPKDYPKSFANFVHEAFDSYTNINILLKRNHAYDPVGRNQTEAEAIEIDKDIYQFLNSRKLPYYEIISSDNTSQEIFDLLRKEGKF